MKGGVVTLIGIVIAVVVLLTVVKVAFKLVGLAILLAVGAGAYLMLTRGRVK